ncbi:MAG: hypothetical protein A4S14_08855 [Proteobacteria bacterium SG_bin9]|nr:MAG: hypothetical protein A4S14_08855 [Proteobacteria bacterium SG_bin9]
MVAAHHHAKAINGRYICIRENDSMLLRLTSVLAAVAMLTSVSAGTGSAAEPVAADAMAADVTAVDSVWWAKQVDGSGFKPAKRGKEWWRAIVAQNPSCGMLSNGCQTCFVGRDSFDCSNPGFACVASETWTCGVRAHLAGK